MFDTATMELNYLIVLCLGIVAVSALTLDEQHAQFENNLKSSGLDVRAIHPDIIQDSFLTTVC